MRFALRIFAGLAFFLNLASAGTVTFSDQVGNYFAFRGMNETGELVPPSRLETPTLVVSPNDTIKFSPSAYVVVENTGSNPVSSTLSTKLALSLESVAALGLGELNVSVAGTWGSQLYLPAPTGSATVGLSLQLDLVFGGVTKNFVVPVTQNLVDKTWAGSLAITQQVLRDNFVVPAGGILQLGVTATPTVTANATYANARSAITYLDISAKAVPEPGPGSLLVAGAIALGLARILHRRGR